jgi:hypothetical protein
MVLPSDVRGVRIHTAFHLVNRIWLLLSFKLKLTNKPLCTVMACTSHSKKISLNQISSAHHSLKLLRVLLSCRRVWALLARKSTHWGARICRTIHATKRPMNGISSEDVPRALKRQVRLQRYLATDIQVEAPSIQYDDVHFVKFLPISPVSFVLSTLPRSRLFEMPN